MWQLRRSQHIDTPITKTNPAKQQYRNKDSDTEATTKDSISHDTIINNNTMKPKITKTRTSQNGHQQQGHQQ